MKTAADCHFYHDNDDDDKREHGKKSAAQACTINGSPPKTPSHNTAVVSGATEDRDGNVADLALHCKKSSHR
jgi:hypothetical protein